MYSDLRRQVPNENKQDGRIVSKKAAAQQGYSTTPLSSVYCSALQSRPHVSPSPSVTPRRSCDRTRHNTQSPSVGERPHPCLLNVPPSLRISGQVSCEAGPWSGEPRVWRPARLPRGPKFQYQDAVCSMGRAGALGLVSSQSTTLPASQYYSLSRLSGIDWFVVVF